MTVHLLIFGVAVLFELLAGTEAVMNRSLLAGAVAFIALGFLVGAA